MGYRRVRMPVPAQPRETTSVELGEQRRLEVENEGATTRIRVRSPHANERIELELCFTPTGPVIRTRASDTPPVNIQAAPVDH